MHVPLHCSFCRGSSRRYHVWPHIRQVWSPYCAVQQYILGRRSNSPGGVEQQLLELLRVAHPLSRCYPGGSIIVFHEVLHHTCLAVRMSSRGMQKHSLHAFTHSQGMSTGEMVLVTEPVGPDFRGRVGIVTQVRSICSYTHVQNAEAFPYQY